MHGAVIKILSATEYKAALFIIGYYYQRCDFLMKRISIKFFFKLRDPFGD